MKKWNKEQLEAYAAAFRDKDAVYVKGYGWDEVAQVQNDEGGYNCVPYSLSTTNVDKYINSWEMRDGKPWRGYPEDFGENCEIVTLKDYEVQEGDKLVWLKEGYKHWKFGRSYTVEAGNIGWLVVIDEDGFERVPKSESWGVIPKWENVKGDKNTHSERSAEHQALDYLLNQGVGRKEELTKDVIEWAKYYLEELDFEEAKKAIGVAEKLVYERLTEE